MQSVYKDSASVLKDIMNHKADAVSVLSSELLTKLRRTLQNQTLKGRIHFVGIFLASSSQPSVKSHLLIVDNAYRKYFSLDWLQKYK